MNQRFPWLGLVLVASISTGFGARVCLAQLGSTSASAPATDEDNEEEEGAQEPGVSEEERAAGAAPDYQPKTQADPRVPVDVLRIQLKPLTRAELKVEAEAWMALVVSNVERISETELAVRAANAALASVEAGAPGAPPGEAREDPAAGAGEAKLELLARLNGLREERAVLFERAHTVLDALRAKGGDPEEHEQYLEAVAGTTVDPSDIDALWSTLKGWLLSAEGGMRWARNLALFLGTLVVFWILALISGRVVARALRLTKRLSGLLSDFLVTSARRVVLAVGFFVALSALGVDVGPVLAVIGAAGFVIAFALQGSLSNFASGIMILLYRPFDVGDVVEVADVSGKVVAMNLVSTQIRTFDNKAVIVPNNSVWGNVITNATAEPERRVDLVFGIGYSDDIAKAQKILEETVAAHELVLAEPAPLICVHELGESSVNFICRPWAKTSDYWRVYWDVTRRVKERFDAEGVTIPFPQRDVHVYQTNSGREG